MKSNDLKYKTFQKGFFDVLPLLIPVLPFGIIYGAIGIELGFGPFVTYGTSIIIFSGASQIIFLQLLSAGASPLVAIASSSVVSARHLLYGAVFTQYLNNLSLPIKLFLSYILTDQSFAVSYEFFKKNKNNKYKYYHLIGSGMTLWVVWQISTIVGIFLGSIVPEELGLSFAIPLTFLALLINYFRKFDHLIIIILSGIMALFFYELPLKIYIILSSGISLIIASIIVNFKNKIL